MYEKIKFSNFRNIYLGLRYYLRLFFNRKGILELLDDKSIYLLKRKIGLKKILIFCPSLNLDTPNFLNVGLRAFINSAKCVGAQIEFVQCINFLNICHLGGSPFSPNNKMPCFSCKKVNSKIYRDLDIIELSFEKKDYSVGLRSLSLKTLKDYNYEGINLGKLVSSSIIWIKRHSDLNNESKEYFIRLISDSINLKNYFEKFGLEQYDGVIVFNGISFPEAILYEMCKLRDVNVATFEGGMSKKFEHSIEFNYDFTPQHKFKFDKYKNYDEKFFEDQVFARTIDITNTNKEWKSTVSIFTNVSWDTSQYVSNSVFESMYDWLESLKEVFDNNSDVNFVIRPHPGENRKIKKTFYTVTDWYGEKIHKIYPNVSLLNNVKNSSSYNLIKQSDLILVYNSTIGIEATLLGKKVIVSAKSHYSNLGFVISPQGREEYLKTLNESLGSSNFEIDDSLIDLSKKYYYQLCNDVAYPLDSFMSSQNNKTIKINENNLTNETLLKETRFIKLVENFLNKKELKYSN